MMKRRLVVGWPAATTERVRARKRSRPPSMPYSPPERPAQSAPGRRSPADGGRALAPAAALVLRSYKPCGGRHTRYVRSRTPPKRRGGTQAPPMSPGASRARVPRRALRRERQATATPRRSPAQRALQDSRADSGSARYLSRSPQHASCDISPEALSWPFRLRAATSVAVPLWAPRHTPL